MARSTDDWYADHAAFVADAPDDEFVEAQALWDVGSLDRSVRPNAPLAAVVSGGDISVPVFADEQIALVQRSLVEAWARSTHCARWDGDNQWYVVLDWTLFSGFLERRLGIPYPLVGRITRKAIVAMKTAQGWDSMAVSWDVDTGFPDGETAAITIRRSLLPTARKLYATGPDSPAP